MLSHTFVAKVRQSPLGIKALAEQAGASRFWVSRLLHYADACTARDRRIVKMGRLVGLQPDEVFERGGPQLPNRGLGVEVVSRGAVICVSAWKCEERAVGRLLGGT